MADYLIKGETLSDIADAIRSKTGTKDSIEAAEMATKISQITGSSGEDLQAVITEQAALIGELSTTLEGKAGGSGGATVDTCTVTITNLTNINYMSYSKLTDGNITAESIDISGVSMLEDVVCNSPICMASNYSGRPLFTTTGDVTVLQVWNIGTSTAFILKATGDCTIETYNDGGL